MVYYEMRAHEMCGNHSNYCREENGALSENLSIVKQQFQIARNRNPKEYLCSFEMDGLPYFNFLIKRLQRYVFGLIFWTKESQI